ncbi:polyphosphate kinase 2 family protein [candidate division KSB1 bacterium]|nr:polyphosphate kinase 2 family protein [candidate division KSB1 bacterium]
MERYRLKPGDPINLKKIDANDAADWSGKKQEAKDEVKQLNARLDELQEIFYAQGKHKLLIVLQGMDTSGKDGTIRKVFDNVNPQGVRVANFKSPTQKELSHDFLWRVHHEVPEKGMITIFNRSHYEDVLIVRVHDMVSKDIWGKRYELINEFEKLLYSEGTTILKFYLHIDKIEQKKRLQSRVDKPEKHWKFNPADLKERKHWDEYIKAYEDALMKTSTDYAPWYIVPANRKWYRNLVISKILVNKLEELEVDYPKPVADFKDIKIV